MRPLGLELTPNSEFKMKFLFQQKYLLIIIKD